MLTGKSLKTKTKQKHWVVLNYNRHLNSEMTHDSKDLYNKDEDEHTSKNKFTERVVKKRRIPTIQDL